jgi:hypothetical protein
LSIPGHLVGLTPSIGQIFKSNPPVGYLHARYRNVVLGYAIIGALLLIVAVGIAHLRTVSQPARLRTAATYIVAIAAVAVVTVATHTGERAHTLSAAATAGVTLAAPQSRALDSTAKRAVSGYAGASDDLAIQGGWVIVPRTCEFTNETTGLLGATYHFVCSVDAFNSRLHRAPAFRVAVECGSARPTARGCSSLADADVSQVTVTQRRVTQGTPPTPTELRRLTSDLPALIPQPCVQNKRPPSAQALNAAIDDDQLYMKYGSTAFRLVPGGSLRTMSALLKSAANENRHCAPTITAILTAALPRG